MKDRKTFLDKFVKFGLHLQELDDFSIAFCNFINVTLEHDLMASIILTRGKHLHVKYVGIIMHIQVLK